MQTHLPTPVPPPLQYPARPVDWTESGPPMTAAEALAKAAAEGLTLPRASNQSGFLGVAYVKAKKARPYQAMVSREGKQERLGRFATAEEAALCRARTPEGQAANMCRVRAPGGVEASGAGEGSSSADAAALAAAALPPRPLVRTRPPPPPVSNEEQMTAEAALAAAGAEGLVLQRSESKTGYAGVYKGAAHVCGTARPYQAMVSRDGKQICLGRFATAEQAALCRARTPEGRAACSHAASLPPAMSADEAEQQAAAEGLSLRRSDNQTGFAGVYINTSNGAKPFEARVRRAGRKVSLGHFSTAEAAALCVARSAAEDAHAMKRPRLDSGGGGLGTPSQPIAATIPTVAAVPTIGVIATPIVGPSVGGGGGGGGGGAPLGLPAPPISVPAPVPAPAPVSGGPHAPLSLREHVSQVSQVSQVESAAQQPQQPQQQQQPPQPPQPQPPQQEGGLSALLPPPPSVLQPPSLPPPILPLPLPQQPQHQHQHQHPHHHPEQQMEMVVSAETLVGAALQQPSALDSVIG